MMIQARVFNMQNMCDGSNSYQYKNLKTGQLLLDKKLMLVMLENQAKLCKKTTIGIFSMFSALQGNYLVYIYIYMYIHRYMYAYTYICVHTGIHCGC